METNRLFYDPLSQGWRPMFNGCTTCNDYRYEYWRGEGFKPCRTCCEPIPESGETT